MMRVARIADFCSTGTGGTPPRDRADRYFNGGTIPWVKSGELRESIVTATEEHLTEAALKETNVKLIPPGALLLAMYGATVGRLGILGVPATTNQAVCHIIPDPKHADIRYLFHTLRTCVPTLLGRRVGGAQPNISQGIVRELAIPLPSLTEQRRIAVVLDQAEALRAKRRAALAELDTLTQSIFLDHFGDPLTNPKGWELRKIGEEVRLQGGYAFKSSDYIEAGVRLVKISNVQKDNIDWSETDYLPDRYIEEFSEFALSPGELVLALTRPIIKSLNSVKIAVVRPCDVPCLLNQRVGRFCFQPDSALTPTYLLEFCRAKKFFNAVQSLCSESLQPNISTSQVEEIDIPIPPRDLQYEFARRVAAVEKLKTAQRASLAELDALFASLQHRAFRGEL